MRAHMTSGSDSCEPVRCKRASECQWENAASVCAPMPCVCASNGASAGGEEEGRDGEGEEEGPLGTSAGSGSENAMLSP